MSAQFFGSLSNYLSIERPETASDALFVVLKGARAGAPLSINGLEQIVAVGQDTSRFVNRCNPHCRLCGRADERQ